MLGHLLHSLDHQALSKLPGSATIVAIRFDVFEADSSEKRLELRDSVEADVPVDFTQTPSQGQDPFIAQTPSLRCPFPFFHQIAAFNGLPIFGFKHTVNGLPRA